MKYVLLIGDGMADRPLSALDGKTVLEASHTPNLDFLAVNGRGGTVQTVPEGCAPGSDVANLSIFGYDPKASFTGRAPLEAASMGIVMKDSDIAFRCNLVTVEAGIMQDYCAGHISTSEGEEIIQCLNEGMGMTRFRFHPGVSYRHLALYDHAPGGWKEGRLSTTPPHDILGKPIEPHLPAGFLQQIPREIMARSRNVLKDCHTNRARRENGKPEANMIWLWGHGAAASLPSFQARWGLSGAVISAVDLVRGIGASVGLTIEKVPGATGYLDTNYAGKVERALAVLKEKDFVYLHVEAPDEAGHTGEWKLKRQAIEDFDAKVVEPLLEGLKTLGDYRIMVLPDHATPLETRTHGSEPVPFVIYGGEARTDKEGMTAFSENAARETGWHIAEGHELIESLIK